MDNCLSPQEAAIISMRLGLDRPETAPLKQVCAKFQVSPKHVRAIEKKVLDYIRQNEV
ncbi:MAG: sigma factor-like helix-turn-helix DNA-binding protein [Desulfitobacteriaceae bacterium]